MKNPPNNDEKMRLAPIMWFFYATISVALTLTGFAAAQTGDGRPGIYCVLWALAFLAAGMCVGFLFGIPKILQGNAAPAPAGDQADGNARLAYQQQVNTNLTEISDWLTKIIVGAGLIHLKQIPDYVARAAGVLSNSLLSFNPAGNYVGLASAIIIAFTSLGFLFGYLTTRLYLSPLFATADRLANSYSEAIKAVSAQIASVKGELSMVASSIPTLQKPPEAGDAEGSAQAAEAEKTAQLKVEELAQNYLNTNFPSYVERVGAKEKAANEIARLGLSGSVSRDWLTSKATAPPSDGVVAGLATLINSIPEAGDLERLEKMAQVSEWKHSRFKIAVALGRLFSSNVATDRDVAKASEILKLLSKGDTDNSLLRQIGETAALIRQATGKSVDLPPDKKVDG